MLASLAFMTKHRLDPLASIIWYQAVEHGLGLDSPIAVELFLEGDRVKRDHDGIKRPRKWRHFSQGKRTPKDVPGTLNVYDIAERQAPGSARWFRSPIWPALKDEFSTKYEVEDALSKLEPIATMIFKHETFGLSAEELQDLADEMAELTAKLDRVPTQLTATHNVEPENIVLCAEFDELDLLEAVILLLEHGRLSGSLSVTRRALELYEASSTKIAAMPELAAALPTIFEKIESRYASNINTPYDEYFPPWHFRMPGLFEQVYDIAAMRAEALKQP